MSESINQEFEGSLLADLMETIRDLEWALENYDGACCGMACNCYDNNKSDLIEAYAELNKLGVTYDGNYFHDMTGQNS